MIAYSVKAEYIIAPVAQWIAQWISNPLVVGSNPTGGAKRKELLIRKHRDEIYTKCLARFKLNRNRSFLDR